MDGEALAARLLEVQGSLKIHMFQVWNEQRQEGAQGQNTYQLDSVAFSNPLLDLTFVDGESGTKCRPPLAARTRPASMTSVMWLHSRQHVAI
jgi:hypothetical protein